MVLAGWRITADRILYLDKSFSAQAIKLLTWPSHAWGYVLAFPHNTALLHISITGRSNLQLVDPSTLGMDGLHHGCCIRL